jgi:hypothetical protein
MIGIIKQTGTCRVFFLASIIVMTGLTGCSQDDEMLQTNGTETLSLVAPNGQLIAENRAALNSESSGIIEGIYGERKEFQITELVYYPMQKGYLVEIRYVTYDGIKGKYIKTNNASEIGNASNNVIRLKNGSESGSTVTTVYSCKNNNHQKCPDCEMVMIINNDGSKNPRCFCSQGDRNVCELKTTVLN